MARIRLLTATSEPFLRRRLRDAALEERDLEVVSECADGLEALDEVRWTRPEAIVLDLSLPRLSGLDVMRKLDADRGPAAVCLTADGEGAQEALDLGALGCVRQPV